MKVQDVMTTDVATIGPDALLKDAADRARPPQDLRHAGRRRRRRGARRPLRDRHPRQGRRRAAATPASCSWLVDPADPWITARFDAVTVGDAMSAPARTIAPNRPIAEAATLMLDEDVNRLPVVDADGALVGVVSRGDLVRAFARTDEEIRAEIEEDVIRKVMWLSPTAVDVTVTDGVVTLEGEVATECRRASCCRRSPARCRASSTSARR